MRFLALAVGILTALVNAQGEPLKIAGRVVNGVTGEALENVRVSMFRSGQELSTSITKSDGRFQFFAEKGTYHLFAERTDFGRQGYGRHPGGFGVAIIADGATASDNLVFRLFPPSAISGKVLDTAGEPVENALVHLIRASVVWGRRKLVTQGFAHADDRGRFRFGRLTSGNYYMIASGTPWHSGQGEAQSQRPAATFLPSHFPNSNSVKNAAPLVLRAGEEAEADFTLTERPGYGIQLHVEGEIARGAQVQLKAEGLGSLDRFQYSGALYGNDLSIPAVAPGSYELIVEGQNKGRTVAASARVKPSTAKVSVLVTPRPLPRVTGKLTCDGRAPSSVSTLRVISWDETLNAPTTQSISPEGDFEFPALRKGRILLSTVGADCYSSRLLRDGQEVPNRWLMVEGEDISGITIEGLSGVAEVKGFVRRGANKIEGVFALLAPTKDSSDPGDFHAFTTDSDGSYAFWNVRPGEYWLYAVDEDDFEFANRQVIASHLKGAERILVLPGRKYEKDIQLLGGGDRPAPFF